MLNDIPYTNVIEMMLTRKCNMNCKYCFEHDKNGKELDLDEAYSLLTKNNYSLPIRRFYMFGGEPLLNLEFMVNLIERIKADNTICSKTKDSWIHEITHNITTNGTLIDKNIDLLRDYGFTLQVSLDGPEEINDLNRVDHNGKGHFKQIEANLKLCRDNGVDYCLHGAVSHNNYKNFDKINEWFLEQMILSIRDKDNIIKYIPTILYHNYCQLVFEDDITDEELDELLKAYDRTIQMIFSTPLLKDFDFNTRKLVAEGFLARRGGICSAGNTMFAIDDKMFLYPCHRWMTSGLDQDHCMSFDGFHESRPNGRNYYQYEQLLDLPAKGIMFGELYDNDTKDENNKQFQANWCPSTNYEITGSVCVYPAHYTMLIAELQNFIPKIAEYYDLDIESYNKKYLKYK